MERPSPVPSPAGLVVKNGVNRFSFTSGGIPVPTRADDLQSAEYLRLNPNARIPTLVDGDLALWESMAINLYLAQKYEGQMHFAGPEFLGLAAQWRFWTM